MFYKTKPTKQLLISGGHKLLIPWLVFAIAGHLVNCINLAISGDNNWKHYLLTPFKELLFTGGLEGNQPLWFLFTLFCTQLVFNFLHKKEISSWVMVFCGVAWAIGMYQLGYNSPTYMVNIPLAIAVYALGYLWKEKQFSKLYVSISAIVYFAILLICPSHLIFAANTLNSGGIYVFAIIFSIAGCILFNNIFKHFPHLSILQYVGKHSMVYYVSHWLLLTLCLIAFEKLGFSNIMLVALMCFSCLFIPPVIERMIVACHLGKILGKR